MSSIILYLGLCFLGYIIAIPMRSHRDKMGFLGPLQSAIVLLLVFTMGARLGSNPDIVSNLDRYGIYALTFTVIIAITSTVLTMIARKMLGINRKGHMGRKVDPSLEIETPDSSTPAKKVNSFTILIASFVGLGILFGYLLTGRIFSSLEQTESVLSFLISLEVCILLFFVGFDMGLSGEMLGHFKKVGPRVLFIPIAIMLGSLLGAFITGLLLPIDMREALAIGSGMGYYSLGAAIMIDGGMITGGAISFLHNVMREFFSLLLIPVIAKKIGYVESVALPGATAMDVCLPIIAQSTQGNATVYAFVSGILLTAIVPVLVPLFVFLS